MTQGAVEMVANGEHVAGEPGRGIGCGLALFGFQPATDILRLSVGVKRLAVRLFQQLLELGHAVMLGQLRRVGRGFRTDFVGFVVQVFLVHHLIYLVRACAVKSTMGTTRA